MAAPSIPPGPSSTYTPPFYTSQLNPLQLPNLRKALSNVRRGVGPLRIACFGDSITRGYLSLAGANDFSMGWPQQLARYLVPQYGLKGNWNNIFGFGGETLAQLLVEDTRLTVTGAQGHGAGAPNTSLGGQTFNCTAAGSFTFAPTDNVDSFDLYYTVSSTTVPAGSFNWSVDAGATTLISTSGANAVGKLTIPAGAAGAHSLTIAWVSGTVQVLGVDAYTAANVNSTVTVLNGGVVGALASNGNYAVSPWSQINSSLLTALGLHAVIVNYGANEAITSATATYTTNMQAIISAIQAAGIDVILMTCNPIVITSASLVNQQSIMSQIAALSVANSCPIIDVYQRWGSASTVLQPLGYYGATPYIHPNAVGYGDNAAQIASQLFNI